MYTFKVTIENSYHHTKHGESVGVGGLDTRTTVLAYASKKEAIAFVKKYNLSQSDLDGIYPKYFETVSISVMDDMTGEEVLRESISEDGDRG